MFRSLSLIVFLVLATATAEAQGNLSEAFSIIRTEGRSLSPSGRTRLFEILMAYSTGEKLSGEWQTLNEGISDPDPFVRDQACAFLAATLLVNMTKPIVLPDATKNLVVQRFGEAGPNLRGNAVRIVVLMAGGVPLALVPQLLQMAQKDSESEVRGVAVGALASIPSPPAETTEFWIQSLNDRSNTQLRAKVLSAFRSYAPSDPRVIALVIDALRDTDYYVRQEAIASVVKIGKPATAAIPLLTVIRDSQPGDPLGETMRSNADRAIRILSAPPSNR